MTNTRQYHLPLPVHETMAAQDFLIAPPNAEAVQWLLERTPQSWSSHALLLWGPEGSGKTHLLSVWAEKNRAQRVTLCDPVLSAIVDGKASARAFALDEADAVAKDPDAQEWLQHFYNATKAASAPVLLTARTPPAQWSLTLRDIETRLKSCHTIALQEPDDELMRGLLLKLFSDRQLLVESDVVAYLAARLERTGTALRQAVTILDEAALAGGKKISIPFAQKTLKL